MKYDDLAAYLSAYEADRDIAVVPIPAVARYFGVTPPSVTAMAKSGKLEIIKIGKTSFISIRSLLRQKDQYRKDFSIVKRELIKLAKSGIPSISYEPIMNKIGLTPRIPAHRNKIGQILGDISEQTFEEKKIMLSVLVHRKTTGTTLPGPGFFDLAENLGYEWEDAHDFVAEETDNVLAAYAD